MDELINDLYNGSRWTSLELKSIVRAPVKPAGTLMRAPVPPPTYQIAFKLGGYSRICYRGKLLDFTDGTVLYLPMEPSDAAIQYDKLIVEEGSSIVLFFLSRDRLPGEGYVTEPGNVKATGELFQRIYNTWMNKQPAYYCDCMSLMYRIIAAMQRYGQSGRDAEYYRLRLTKSVAYIHKHFCEPKLDQRRLAEVSDMNYDYFRHIFKSVYHISPIQFINRLKLDYAKELLINRIYTIQEISEITGFSSQYYFARCFKSYVGLPPSKYREGDGGGQSE